MCVCSATRSLYVVKISGTSSTKHFKFCGCRRITSSAFSHFEYIITCDLIQFRTENSKSGKIFYFLRIYIVLWDKSQPKSLTKQMRRFCCDETGLQTFHDEANVHKEQCTLHFDYNSFCPGDHLSANGSSLTLQPIR